MSKSQKLTMTLSELSPGKKEESTKIEDLKKAADYIQYEIEEGEVK